MNKLQSSRSDRRQRRGAALVEMAIALPLLLILLFGVIEYGWAFLKASQVGNAARFGARVAVRPAATEDEVLEAIESRMVESGLSQEATGYTVSVSDLSVSVGESVTVTVTVPYSVVTLTGGGFFPLPQHLQNTVTMSKEGPSGPAS